MFNIFSTNNFRKNLLLEVTSKSQTYAQMARKLTNIVLANPNTKWKVIGWAAWIAKLFT